eukprot:TRINITY_DN8566_c0_g1_i3.p1 TRINITY_DN8566_c0_g1~~TRINITY_DN8566_c0_g1_i3.p1  ORF type:complete len:706 (+),score=84.37 TRINITY_DN8566_c0_g1_i3:264-2120(+)
MAAIKVKPGARIRVALVDDDNLPKADFCKLRAVDPAFLDLPNPRAILESEFNAKYRTLTQGVQVAVQYNGKPYALAIEELEPERACRLFDTELVVDLQGMTSMDTATDQDQVLVVPFGHKDGTSWSIPPFKSVYLTCELTKGQCIDVDVQWSSGEADVFLKHGLEAHFACEQANIIPRDYSHNGIQLSAITATEDGIVLLLTNPASDPAHGTCAVVTNLPSATPSSAADSTLCPNCEQPVPTHRLQMHLAFCERHNIKCPVCHQVVAKKDMDEHQHCEQCIDRTVVLASNKLKAKHNRLFHQSRACSCGAQLPLLQLQQHCRTECPNRSVICRYCYLSHLAGPPNPNLRDRMAGLTAHESECGSRTDVCPTCNKRVKLKDFEMHARLHTMEQSARPPPRPQQQQKDPAELARLRDAAWARAGFGDDTRDIEPTSSQAALPEIPEIRSIPSAPIVEDPTHFCANQLCVEPCPKDASLCPNCLDYIKATSGVGTTLEGQALLAALMKTYFIQLSQGCGRSHCTNAVCKTGGAEPREATQAAAEAMQWVQQATKHMYSLCVEEEVRLIANQVLRLANPLIFCRRRVMQETWQQCVTWDSMSKLHVELTTKQAWIYKQPLLI